MDKDINIAKLWKYGEIFRGSNVFPELCGYLEGTPFSSYSNHSGHFCPHIIVKGGGIIKTEEGKFPASAGDMFCLWPGRRVDYETLPESPWKFYYFHTGGIERESFIRACGFSPKRLFLKPEAPAEAEKIFRSIYNFLDDNSAGPFEIISFMFKLPAACVGMEKDTPVIGPGLLFLAEKTIEKTLYTGLNVNELCGMLGISRSTLFRVFKERLGVSPVEYIKRARINKAAKLLLESSFSIETISSMCGFNSAKYFFRCFRVAKGTTPLRYRKNSGKTTTWWL